MDKKPPNPQLNNEQKSFIVRLSNIHPPLSQDQIQALFFSKFSTEVSKRQISFLLQKVRNGEEDPRKETLTIEVAEEIGLLTLTNRVKRLVVLEDIVKRSVEGYRFESISPKGEVVSFTKIDFPTAITAIKAIKDEIGTLTEQQAQYVIHIGEHKPPQTPDDEELEGYEDL